jgi:hypothetical protein
VSNVIQRAPFSQALTAYLRRATGLRGDFERAPLPDDGATAPDLPYWVLYSIPGGGLAGPPSAVESDAAFVYQVTAVGERGDQTEMVLDRVRVALLTRGPSGVQAPNLGIAGMTIMGIELDGMGGLEGFQAAIGSGAERYVFWLTLS